MKFSTPKFFFLLALIFAFGNTQITAQSTSSDDVTVVQKITHEDGVVTVKKKKIEKGQSLDAYLKALELKDPDGKHVEVKVLADDGQKEVLHLKNHGDEETLLFIRRAKEEANDELESLKIIIGNHADDDDDHDDDDDRDYEFKFDNSFKHVYHYKHKYSNDSKKTFLGIYLDDDADGQGIYVDGVVSGSGASAAGLKEGDIITAIQGNSITDRSDLRFELNNHEPGDKVTVAYLRNGQTRTTEATLSGTPSSYTKERDPCKVFIGVYCGGHNRQGKGVRASGIIPNTAASKTDLQRGDVILALNDVPTNSHRELQVERDKNSPGDYFTLTVDRDGAIMEIDAQFLECPDDEVEEEVIEEQALIEEVEVEQPEIEVVDNTLILEDLNAFPNPTYGNFNLRFSGEAVPTNLIITNIMGKVIYKEDLQNFDGNYNKELNIKNSSPGTHLISIRQGNKMFTTSIILLVRA